MDHNSWGHVPLSYGDPIDQLGLSARPLNALRRASIVTVGRLVRTLRAGHLLRVRNIGQKSLREIESCLASVRLVSAPNVPEDSDGLVGASGQTVASPSVTQAEQPPRISEEVVRWQAGVIRKQMRAGLLHQEAKVAGKTIAQWLSVVDDTDLYRAYCVMATILGASINVCEEVSSLLNGISDRNIDIFISRYGLHPRTLAQVGVEVGVTRARVSQIARTLKKKLGAKVMSALGGESDRSQIARQPLVRMQSALLVAKDMGLDITYEEWERRIRSSGLVGGSATSVTMNVDPIEASVAICNLLEDEEIAEVRVPGNLKDAVKLATSGSPHLPAKSVRLRRTLAKETKRLIERHLRYCGGVGATWLREEIGEELWEVGDILGALGYRPLSENWFVPSVLSRKHKIGKQHVFHHAVRRMSQYCGPLAVEDICSGIRHAAWRTSFPVPPPNVMGEILQVHGYTLEDGLYYWDGESGEQLSRGELLIMDCLRRNGPVVHHSELAEAFIGSELSFPSLHRALRHSPLFERIGTGLYKLRGQQITRQAVERAEAAAERIPVDPETQYDKQGTVIVSATLSAIAVGIGVVSSEQFPNLAGRWNCFVNGRRLGTVDATDKEFRRLKRPLEKLGCRVGDRLKFRYNTWDRSVTIEKVEHTHAT